MGHRQVNSSVSKRISKARPGRGLTKVSSLDEGRVTVRRGRVLRVGPGAPAFLGAGLAGVLAVALVGKAAPVGSQGWA